MLGLVYRSSLSLFFMLDSVRLQRKNTSTLVFLDKAVTGDCISMCPHALLNFCAGQFFPFDRVLGGGGGGGGGGWGWQIIP